MPYYQVILKREWETRRARNPKFSLRAFARYLALTPATLSRVLSGSRGMSLALGLKIARRLALSERQTRRFLFSVAVERYRVELERLGCARGEAADAPGDPGTEAPPEPMKQEII